MGATERGETTLGVFGTPGALGASIDLPDVPEHRGVSTAFAVAILSTGLGGLVAFGVGRGLQDKPFEWFWLTDLCLGLTVAGVVAGLAVFWRLWVVRGHRLKINGFIKQGNRLLFSTLGTTAATTVNLRYGRTMPEEELVPAYEAWRTLVYEWLSQKRPYWADYFENRAGARTAEELYQDIGRNHIGLTTEIQHATHEGLSLHLQRLAEILMKL